MRVLALVALPALALVVGSVAVTEIPKAYDQPYRPQFHFSPREHWTNDPNGLVYFEGEYHLFYQYNPFGDEWGHMSWGHAVSTDLMHWTELPVALKEENGIMIFTGSAVVDEHNSSGFCTNNKPCLVAVYTGYTPARGSKKSLQTQNLAYSNDRGRTWTKYSGNPILDLHMTDFRDPKVFWFEKTKRWIMGVSLPDDHKIRFYESTNLRKWTQTSDFGPAGATGGQWECPELFELPVQGGGGNRWVLKVGLNPGARLGGSGEQYFVGDFDGKNFKNENPSSLTLWTDYGKDCYCALTFNHLPQTHAAVMIGWMDNWQYAAKLPTSPWRGQMTVPRKLWLRNTAEGIRLYQEPVDELQGLRVSKQPSGPAKTHTFEIVSSMKMGAAAQQVGWKILQGSGVLTTVGYDGMKHVVFIDRTRSGTVAFSPDFPSRMEAPLNASGRLQLRIVVDRSSVEVFAEDGRVAMTSLVFPPADASGVEAYGLDGNAGSVEAAIWQLRSTHD